MALPIPRDEPVTNTRRLDIVISLTYPQDQMMNLDEGVRMESTMSRLRALLFGLSIGGLIFVAGCRHPMRFLARHFRGDVQLHDTVETKCQVLLFLDTQCPVCQGYAPRLRALIEQYRTQGVNFEAYFPNQGENDAKIRSFLSANQLNFDWSYDPGAERAKKYGVSMVPSVVVVSTDQRVRYAGAIDDNKDASLAKRPYLAEALDAVLGGKTPKLAKTTSIGCVLEPGDGVPDAKSITYSSHVARLLNQHCVQCHQPNQSAPFSLVGYANAKAKANMIAYITKQGKMPPWKAVPGYGDFHDVNILTPAERLILERWAQAGAPAGDDAVEVASPAIGPSWPLGKPDSVISMPAEYELHADKGDVYRHFVIDPKLTEPKWVVAMDVHPGNRRIVHHVIAFIDKSGQSARLEAANTDGQPGYTTFGGPGFIPSGSLGGWAPGLQSRKLPEGVAFRVDPGAKIVLEVHYHPDGKVERDKTEVALYYADKPADREIDIAWMVDLRLRLRPGDSQIHWDREFSIQRDSTLYMVMPHMHMLGRSMKAFVRRPDGSTEPIVWVDDWDFNWQLTYYLRQPMFIPKGSSIVVETIYDNSADNPNNPNHPPKVVTWGEETTDEMFLLVAGLVASDGRSHGTSYLMARPVQGTNSDR